MALLTLIFLVLPNLSPSSSKILVLPTNETKNSSPKPNIQTFSIVRMKRSEVSDNVLKDIASHFQIAIDNRYAFNSSAVQRLHQLNPQIKALKYLNATVVGDNEPYYLEIKVHPDWFLLNASGKRVNVYENPHRFPLDPGNSGWQDYIAKKAYERINSSNYDGIFLDVVLPYLKVGLGNFDSKPVNPRTGKEYTSEQWARDQDQKLEKIKKKIGNKLLISNGVGWGKSYYEYNGEIFFDTVDGIMVEGFVRWGSTPLNVFRSEKDWKSDVDMLKEIDSKVKIVLVYTKFLDTLPGTPEQKEDYRLYSLTTFLLGKGVGQFYLVGEIEANEFGTTRPRVSTVYQPSWGTEIGAPLGDYYKQGGVYQRDFTGGKVLVNPTYNTQTLNLPRPYKTLEGRVVSEVALAHHTGMILLKTEE